MHGTQRSTTLGPFYASGPEGLSAIQSAQNAGGSCSVSVTSGYSCKSCGTTYSSPGICTKILGYTCNKCGTTSTSGGTCSRITSYKCNVCGTTGTSSGACTNQTTYTYYTMNCGF